VRPPPQGFSQARCSSKRVTGKPADASRSAQRAPEGPPPTITMRREGIRSATFYRALELGWTTNKMDRHLARHDGQRERSVRNLLLSASKPSISLSRAGNGPCGRLRGTAAHVNILYLIGRRQLWKQMGRIVSQGELIALLGRSKRGSRRVVFTNGCFDLLHPGHIRTL
jgi:hypothetical protein